MTGQELILDMFKRNPDKSFTRKEIEINTQSKNNLSKHLTKLASKKLITKDYKRDTNNRLKFYYKLTKEVKKND